ncbi:MAG: hypothetical protein ACOCW3_06030 [Spirochaetota bacterium]
MSSSMKLSQETLDPDSLERIDMDAAFAAARSHTTHWMTFPTIVLAELGIAMTFAIVCAG